MTTISVDWLIVAALPFALALVASGQETAAPLPEGSVGIASRYPGDLGIGKDPAVIVAEDFESGTEGKLQDGWRPERAHFVAPEHNLFPSRHALEWVLTQQPGQVGASASHWFRPGFDQVFARVYWWLAPDLKVVNMHGWGIQALKPGLDASITTGHKATGDDAFCAFLDYPFSDLSPYVYHPEQKTRFGDHFSSGFKMELGRWYCTEIMLKGNTPDKRDGELALWVDGRLIKHWTGLRLRDVAELKINRLDLEFFSHDNRRGTNRVRFDNLVIATSYIGPAVPHVLAIGPPSGRRAEPRTEQEAAAAAIKEHWGKVIIDEMNPTKPVLEVYLSGSLVNDTLLERIKGLTQLRTLDLSFTQVTDHSLRYLKGLTQLQELNLCGVPVTDAGLEEIKDLRQLRRLNLGCDHVTDAGLERLKGMDQLRTLELWNAHITDAGLENLKGLTQLQTLVLAKTGITGAGLEHLKGLKQLRTLNLSDTRVRDVGLEHLAGLQQLENLVLARTGTTDAGLKPLAALQGLQILDLGGSLVTDAGLENLSGLRQLRTLGLVYTRVTGVGLAHLEGLNQLRSLDLGFAQITEAGLQPLEGLAQLRQLDLAGAQLTDAGLEHLKKMKQLRTLGIRKTRVTPAGLRELRKVLPNLRVEGGP